ncbi:hypothetical protein JL09_g6238, partial [Pichia kudriavzevii]
KNQGDGCTYLSKHHGSVVAWSAM